MEARPAIFGELLKAWIIEARGGTQGTVLGVESPHEIAPSFHGDRIVRRVLSFIPNALKRLNIDQDHCVDVRSSNSPPPHRHVKYASRNLRDFLSGHKTVKEHSRATHVVDNVRARQSDLSSSGRRGRLFA